MVLSSSACRTARRRLRVAALWVLTGLAVPAPAPAGETPLPVSTAELCLLLRSGYTGAEVLRDTAGRPLLEPLDANAEKLLRDAGADPALVAALRRSHPVATPAQAQAERARQEELAEHRIEAWETNQSRLREASEAAVQATLATRAQEALQNMARLLRGKLVIYRDQRIQSYDDSHLPDKKQFAFYFAALAEPGCRKFTAQLVKFYDKYAPAHPEFELVFISKDYSSQEMETDVRDYCMPWPALDYAQLSEEKELVKVGNGPLPRLFVVDGAGHLLVDSVVDGRYVGPQHVLDTLNQDPAAAAVAGR